MKKLKYVAISLASILSFTLLDSCSTDTEYVDRIITETDTVWIEKPTKTDTVLSVGQGVIKPSGEKVPLTIMIYGVGGGNLDISQNYSLLQGLKYFAEDGNTRVTLGKDINIVGQYKFSSDSGLVATTGISQEKVEPLGGHTFRYIFNTQGYTEYKEWCDDDAVTFNGMFSAIYKYSDCLNADGTFVMDSEGALADFINYATEVAPADRYILLLDDHGGGYEFNNNQTRAVLIDDNLTDWDGSNMNMSTTQIYEGIVNSNIGKMDAIIFNTCLENNLEELCELVGAADYTVAQSHIGIDVYNWIAFLSFYSTVLETGTDEEFEKMLELFAKAMFASAEETAIVNGVVAGYISSNLYAHDICITKLDGLEDVGAAICDFAKFLIDKQNEEDEKGITTLADSVINGCYTYYRVSRLYDIVDMVSLAHDYYPEEMETIWNKFEKAVKGAIVACYNNSETWEARSSALTNKGYNYDTSWSIYLNSGEELRKKHDQDELDETYGTLRFREYTTDEDNTYSWYTWLLKNNVTPQNNPCAYSTVEAIEKLIEEKMREFLRDMGYIVDED